MESVLLVMIENVDLDRQLCSALGRLYSECKDCFSDEIITAILHRANPLHTMAFHKLTEGRCHDKLVSRLVEEDCLAVAFKIMDKCDEPLYSELLRNPNLELRFLSEVRDADYWSRVELFGDAFSQTNAVRKVFLGMMKKHPQKLVKFKGYEKVVELIKHRSTDYDLDFYHSVVMEAKAQGVQLMVDLEYLRHCIWNHKDDNFWKQKVLDLCGASKDAYQILLDYSWDLDDALSIAREAKGVGVTTLNPLKIVAKQLSHCDYDVAQDECVLSFLKELDCLEDKSMVKKINILQDFKGGVILELLVRSKKWRMFHQTVELLLSASQVEVHLESATPNEAKEFLKQGLVATALELLNEGCDQAAFASVLESSLKSKVSRSKIVQKLELMKKLGYKRGFKLFELSRLPEWSIKDLFYAMVEEHPHLTATSKNYRFALSVAAEKGDLEFAHRVIIAARAKGVKLNVHKHHKAFERSINKVSPRTALDLLPDIMFDEPAKVYAMLYNKTKSFEDAVMVVKEAKLRGVSIKSLNPFKGQLVLDCLRSNSGRDALGVLMESLGPDVLDDMLEEAVQSKDYDSLISRKLFDLVVVRDPRGRAFPKTLERMLAKFGDSHEEILDYFVAFCNVVNPRWSLCKLMLGKLEKDGSFIGERAKLQKDFPSSLAHKMNHRHKTLAWKSLRMTMAKKVSPFPGSFAVMSAQLMVGSNDLSEAVVRFRILTKQEATRKL
ncbi:hypothetical protein SELMODRAFT_411068 [Selaginella moellendorffii]|uniref:Uncharacterized protein n=1 Tax=Selaginella moellendorffii TaxID=88036 RepID=D8RGH4_SELML|nr:hypothetical protein SELMODRAFT_411068 [Selaginella moellendorffii]